MRIELNCAQCGGNRFDYPLRLDADSMIVCADCGHDVGTVVDLQQKVILALEKRKAPPAGAA